MKAYVVDDEPLAVRRLRRMLEEHGDVEVLGTSCQPAAAVDQIRRLRPDVLFLDIEMPGLSGFDVLQQLAPLQPLVIFTTAFPHYALEAFTVDSIDYLVKPVERAGLARALGKLKRVAGGDARQRDVTELVDRMRTALSQPEHEYLARVAARTGDRVEFIDVSDVTYFYAKDKLTFAVARAKHHALDVSIADLEHRLPPGDWVRIHRATLLKLDAVKEVHRWFGGKLLVRLKDGAELEVARDRIPAVRARLGL